MLILVFSLHLPRGMQIPQWAVGVGLGIAGHVTRSCPPGYCNGAPVL